MAKVLAYGGGLNGSVVNVDVVDSKARILRGDWISERNVNSNAVARTVNFDEEFTVRSFTTIDGETYLIAEHEIVISDEELQQRIFVMKSLKQLP
ncbi:hypothetical protein [Kluyvera ascorbata]|uniref:hypothetical protein n=1 Tax=Kluyvera ascorbata TaxID=51288 RepID=UPI0039F65B4B